MPEVVWSMVCSWLRVAAGRPVRRFLLQPRESGRWLEQVGAVRLNAELMMFLDGLSVNCKSREVANWPLLQFCSSSGGHCFKEENGFTFYPDGKCGFGGMHSFPRTPVTDYHKLGWLKTTEMYWLMVLEVSELRCQQSYIFSEIPRKESFLPLVASGSCNP